MKNFIYVFFITTCMVLSHVESNAQSFQKGDVIVNAGIGLGATFAFTSGLGLPLGGGIEFAITEAIGVGGDIGFVSGSGLTALYVGPKGYYHFNELLNIENDQLDIYAGIGLYYRHFSYSGFTFGIGNGIYPGFHIGGRYYFSDNFGVNAELGNSYGWFKAGICLKF